MKLPELKLLMKENNIKGCSLMKKSEIIALLIEKGLIPPMQVNDIPKVNNPKYAHLIGIRNNPKRVEIRDLETGVVNIYPSLYKASRAIGCGTIVITNNDGKVWHERYAINVL